VRANSTGAKTMISPCCVRVRSLHRFFGAMIHTNAKQPAGVMPAWVTITARDASPRIASSGTESG
jgi:hypothetical protein